MKKKTINKLMDVLLGLSALSVIIGTILRFTHYPKGEVLALLGLSGYILISAFEIERLRRIIKKFKKDKENIVQE